MVLDPGEFVKQRCDKIEAKLTTKHASFLLSSHYFYRGVLHSNPMDYAWGANGLDAIITQVFFQKPFNTKIKFFFNYLVKIVDDDVHEMFHVYVPF